jgi:hypothetical protein
MGQRQSGQGKKSASGFIFSLDKRQGLYKFIGDDPERSEAKPGNPKAAS